VITYQVIQTFNGLQTTPPNLPEVVVEENEIEIGEEGKSGRSLDGLVDEIRRRHGIHTRIVITLFEKNWSA
jgi:hypothetical protein